MLQGNANLVLDASGDCIKLQSCSPETDRHASYGDAITIADGLHPYIHHLLGSLHGSGRPSASWNSFDGGIHSQMLKHCDLPIHHIALGAVAKAKSRFLSLADNAFAMQETVTASRGSEPCHHSDQAALSCTEKSNWAHLKARSITILSHQPASLALDSLSHGVAYLMQDMLAGRKKEPTSSIMP